MSKKISIKNGLISLEELTKKITDQKFLVIAADESILKELPTGNWIAGTIPYFMGEDGGVVSKELIFASEICGADINDVTISPYDDRNIKKIAEDAPENGFTIAILPAGSDVHLEYAKNAPSYNKMYFSPIIGWIAGIHLQDADTDQPKCALGTVGHITPDQAMAMHVTLPNGQFANIEIVNLFDKVTGPSITFPETSFSPSKCFVDGKETTLEDYISDAGINTRLPLVADYNSIKVNVSVKDVKRGGTDLYAPVFEGIDYRFAEDVPDYVGEFTKAIANGNTDESQYSCNCILNFLYSELEGKKTGNLIGPITFGEVAYNLVNQTLVYMTINDE